MQLFGLWIQATRTLPGWHDTHGMTSFYSYCGAGVRHEGNFLGKSSPSAAGEALALPPARSGRASGLLRLDVYLPGQMRVAVRRSGHDDYICV